MLSENQNELLTRIPLFAELTSTDMATVAQATSLLSLPKRTNLLIADQHGEVVYFVLEGTVKIYIEVPAKATREAVKAGIAPETLAEMAAPKLTTLSIIGPGEILGEINAIDGGGHSANALTLEPTRVLWMKKADFLRLEGEIPQLSRQLSRLLASRLRLLSSHVFAFSTMSVERRVAYHLLSLLERYNPEAVAVIQSATAKAGKISAGKSSTRSAAPTPFAIPVRVNQGDLADMASASRAIVNTALNALKKENIVTMGGKGNITVLDVERLYQQTL